MTAVTARMRSMRLVSSCQRATAPVKGEMERAARPEANSSQPRVLGVGYRSARIPPR